MLTLNVKLILFFSMSTGVISSKRHVDEMCICCSKLMLTAFYFHLTEEPKLGVYMQNSGGKRLYVKVGLATFLSSRYYKKRYVGHDNVLFPIGHAGAIKGGCQSGI